MKQLLIFVAVILFAPSASADPKAGNVELRLRVDGAIEIDPEGKVHDYAIETRLAPALRDHIDQRVRQWRFEPIMVDGRPVIAKTRMRLNLHAQSTGENYLLRVDSVHFGEPKAHMRGRRGLRYPPNALRERLGAYVMLALRIDAKGNIVDAHPYQTSLARMMNEAQAVRWRRVFEDVAVNAAKNWTFEPTEHIDGMATSATLFAPIEFRIAGSGTRSSDRGWRAFARGPVTPVP